MVEKMVLSVNEVSKALNISRGLTYRLIAEGGLPSIRLGKRVVISSKRLEEFINKETVSQK